MLKTVGNPSTRYGDQTIVNGNLVIGTAGKGIDFSADPGTAGMTSELLDDYEEGYSAAVTVTPTTSGSVTLDPGFNTLAYTKVGRKVTVTGGLLVSSVSLPVGIGFRISSLPFNRGGPRSFDFSPGITVLGANSASPFQFYGYVTVGTPDTLFVFGGTGASEIKAGTEINLTLEYFV
jgi:hypothetical protein